VPSATILIASKQIFNIEARVSKRVELRQTRQVKDLTEMFLEFYDGASCALGNRGVVRRQSYRVK
jgi:hypothetical protein